MEASSFCASKSFSKTLDLVHPVKIRLPKGRSSRHLYRTCASLPSNDDDDADDAADVTLRTDWRTFRAGLVVAEQSSSVLAPNLLPAGDRWAHPLHTPEKGCLLIASPRLHGVHIFERTVVLLLTTSPTPTGIILNRPSLMSIKESRSTPLDSGGVFSDQPLLFGGPVEGGVFLVASNRQVERSGVFEEVMDGVYYGGEESVGCAAEMVKRSVAGAEEFRFFDGCCGWEREQLREEVAGGYWSVVACGGGVVERCVGRVGMWDDLTGIVGQRNVW